MPKERRSLQRESAAPDSTPDLPDEDTALKSLSRTERVRLDIDAWEPSLLRALLEAQNKLPGDRG
jgi:hypothetical protein